MTSKTTIDKFYLRNDILTPILDNLVDNSFIQKSFLFFNNLTCLDFCVNAHIALYFWLSQKLSK
jgi:hypothetical protein